MGQIKCPNCQKEIADNIKFCPKCGEKLENKVIKEETKEELKTEEDKKEEVKEAAIVKEENEDETQATKKKHHNVILIIIIIVVFALAGSLVTMFILNRENKSDNTKVEDKNNLRKKLTINSLSKVKTFEKSIFYSNYIDNIENIIKTKDVYNG